MKLKENFDKFEDTIKDISGKMSGPVKAKADTWMGKLMYREIATLFIWDEHVQGWVFGGWKCPHCKKYNRDKFDECKNCSAAQGKEAEKHKGILELAGEDKEMAITEGAMLKSYLIMKCNNSRKYQKELDDVNEKLAEKPDKLRSKFEKMKDSKFVKWLKKEGE